MNKVKQCEIVFSSEDSLFVMFIHENESMKIFRF